MNDIINKMTQTIIIMEGHDAAGKSNIAIELSRVLGIPYFKGTKENTRFFRKSRDVSYIEAIVLCDFLEQTGYSVIIDRFHISEYVYSLVFGREINHKKFEEIDFRLGILDAKVIYCYKTEFKSYHDELVDIDKIDQIKKDYYEYFRGINTLKYLDLCTDNEDLASQSNIIIEWLNNE
jgi:thymidylate kinase